jgi:hypothetical protein
MEVISKEFENLRHAVGFLQNAYTIVLALALTESFKQFVSDGPDSKIYKERSFLLIAFLFQIFPFFHGMSRYLYTVYLQNKPAIPPHSAAYLMIDGVSFMLMSASFFVMSRSLSPDKWKRYYAGMLALLIVDSIWIGIGLHRGVHEIWFWLVLNAILAVVMLCVSFVCRRKECSPWPGRITAFTLICTTTADYYKLQNFYFPF